MNYIKTTLLSALFLGLLPMAQANAQVDKVLREKDPEFFKTAEARRIGDQLLVWQRNTGGWPKNVDMVTPLTDQQREVIIKDKHVTDDSTIDNGATTTQMNFLARLYQQHLPRTRLRLSRPTPRNRDNPPTSVAITCRRQSS